MKESIGSTASLNIILAFLAIVFAFLAAALSYYKAYKINNIITNTIVKYEGYNDYAIDEINLKLNSLGYQQFNLNCPANKDYDGNEYLLVDSGNVQGVCIYFYNNTNTKQYNYVVTTYMTVNIPIVGEFFRIPVNTSTEDIFGCYGDNSQYGSTLCQ